MTSPPPYDQEESIYSVIGQNPTVIIEQQKFDFYQRLSFSIENLANLIQQNVEQMKLYRLFIYETVRKVIFDLFGNFANMEVFGSVR